MILQILYQFILYPLLVLVFYILSFFDKKIKQGFLLRKNPWPKVDSNLPLYWFHVSSGEFEYAKPVIRELKKKFECKILVTYFSPSVVKNIQNTPEVDYFCASCWDFSWSMNKFIKHFKPKALAVARTDLWPMMLLYSKKNKVKTLLFSATLTSHSPKVASLFGRLFYSLVIENLNHISCVSTDDAENFKKILNDISVSIDGDTRFDQVFYRLNHSVIPMEIKNLIPQNKKVFIAASTWPEDEKIIIPALSNNYFNIIVPHEVDPSHITTIKSKLELKNLAYVTYTDLLKNNSLKNIEALIIDQVGILASIYQVCDVAFIGGSFKKSVHSVMEALACGCTTLVGPYHYNNREALLFKTQGYVKEISNSDDLREILEASQFSSKQEIINYCKLQIGASQKVAGSFW
ncbi:MAG: hypothetical protein IPM57_05965 [Oligoflexia bacterium]|nr:hypothetical protein [Oligoflexia bacterium]